MPRIIYDEGEEKKQGIEYMIVGVNTVGEESWITCRPFTEFDKEIIFAQASDVRTALEEASKH